MSHRAVVNVVVGDNRYLAGQDRLVESVGRIGTHVWTNSLPAGCPRHEDIPYAIKAYALREVAARGATTLLWCDASVVAIRPLAPLWERIERDGYWFSRNCTWMNYTWTADAAYHELFEGLDCIESGRQLNRTIPHVIATAFGISTAHPIGAAFLAEYFRYASQTRAFCGPWANGPAHHDNPRQAPCGPPDVLGHRHDQTCASVIAWRLGMQLTDMPDIMAIKGSETEKTVLLLDGDYA
jgi:hypothetical protein